MVVERNEEEGGGDQRMVVAATSKVRWPAVEMLRLVRVN